MDTNSFLDKLGQDMEEFRPKIKSEKSRMNILYSWLQKKNWMVNNFLHPRGKPEKTEVQYLAHMFAKAGVSKEAGYEFVKDKFGDTEEKLKAEFETEFDLTEVDDEFISRYFRKS